MASSQVLSAAFPETHNCSAYMLSMIRHWWEPGADPCRFALRNSSRSVAKYLIARPSRTDAGPLLRCRHARRVATFSPSLAAASASVSAWLLAFSTTGSAFSRDVIVASSLWKRRTPPHWRRPGSTDLRSGLKCVSPRTPRTPPARNHARAPVPLRQRAGAAARSCGAHR